MYVLVVIFTLLTHICIYIYFYDFAAHLYGRSERSIGWSECADNHCSRSLVSLFVFSADCKITFTRFLIEPKITVVFFYIRHQF